MLERSHEIAKSQCHSEDYLAAVKMGKTRFEEKM
jgi:hypothetical protein